MKAGTFVRRFLVFGPLVTLYFYLRFRALVSPKAEVELAPNLTFGPRSRVGSFTKIKASDGPLRIGRDVHVAVNCFISAGPGGIEIGDDGLVGPGCTIVSTGYRYDELHTPLRLQGQISRGIRIGSNVWLGAGTVVLDGATIGDGVIVSANSVVSGTIPPFAIAQGNPARVIFTRR